MIQVVLDKYNVLFKGVCDELFVGNQVSVNFNPVADFALGNIASNFCILLAAELRTGPYDIYLKIADRLSKEDQSRLFFQDGILYVRIAELSKLFSECSLDHLTPVGLSLPAISIPLVARSNDLSELAYLRILFCSFWQAHLAARIGVSVSLKLQTEKYQGAEVFGRIEALLKSDLVTQKHAAEKRHSLMYNALKQSLPDEQVHLWLHSTCFSTAQIKELYKSYPSLEMHCLTREWLITSRESGDDLNISQISSILEKGVSSLAFALVSPEPLADIDFTSLHLNNKSNFPWLVSTTLDRLTSLPYKDSDSKDSSEVPEVINRPSLRFEELLHLLLFFDYFEVQAAQGKVPQFYAVIYQIAELGYKLLNFPDLRTRWQAGHFSSLERKLLACLEKRLSAIVTLSKPKPS